jgi:phosphoglycolate phosphatase
VTLIKKPHDLILLDLDGTISDPLQGIARSINYALEHFGYTPLMQAELACYIGPPLDESFKLITKSNDSKQINDLVAKYRERYSDIGYAENILYPHISEALAQISATEIPLAVCTSKRADFAERILSLFNLRHYFSFVNGGDIGIQKWQQIKELHSRGLVSVNSVMVGDRAVDLIAANKNGLTAAGVLWGYGSQLELSQENPYYLFNSPLELKKLIKNKE